MTTIYAQACFLWTAALLAAVAAAPGCRARTGGIRCWVDKGALVAPAAFGDIAGDFLIDPATPASQLHVTRAQLAGLDATSVTRDLVFAGRRVGGLTMAVVDLDARTGRFDTTINGVIGADVLGRFVLAIHFSPCRLALSPRGGAGDPVGASARRLEVHMVGGRPLVAARITDGVTVKSGLFAIDTGTWESRIAGAALSRPPTPRPAPAVTGEAPITPVRLRAVELAGRLIEQVPAAAAPGEAEAAGAIGLAVWSRWNLRLDMGGVSGAGRGWLELASPSGPAPAGR